MARPAPRILPCPGLKVTANAGVSFTDCLKRVYDLEKQEMLRPKEAAADVRMCGMPVGEILREIRRGGIYPVLRRNRRVILLFDCALTDWKARQLKHTHLFETRTAKCA